MSEHETRELRQGFTTGTAAAAAAKAALLLLLYDMTSLSVDTPLPHEAVHPISRHGAKTCTRLLVPVSRCLRENGAARAVVIKDAGDDPDVTHGAEIHALVRYQSGPTPLRVVLDGGKGVGRVTLPGLAVPIGQAAINPGPQEQIASAAREAFLQNTAMALSGGTVSICIEVPEGERLALKTMNPRLGIQGGISILGTHGIVRPFSHAAWAASVSLALDVARSEGHDLAVFTTGRKSERLYLNHFPDTPERCLVQAADFFAHACKAAAERGFRHIGWSLFFGKLVKQAQGFENTHAHSADIDFPLLASWCAAAGAPTETVREAATANTARQVLELLRSQGNTDVVQALLRHLAHRAGQHLQAFAPQTLPHFAIFDFDGSLLLCAGQTPQTKQYHDFIPSTHGIPN